MIFAIVCESIFFSRNGNLRTIIVPYHSAFESFISHLIKKKLLKYDKNVMDLCATSLHAQCFLFEMIREEWNWWYFTKWIALCESVDRIQMNLANVTWNFVPALSFLEFSAFRWKCHSNKTKAMKWHKTSI